MRGLMQHCSLSGRGLMDPGTHCISERRMEESNGPHTHSHTNRTASHKHKLPANINTSSCTSHLYERLNRNKWLIVPGADAWWRGQTITHQRSRYRGDRGRKSGLTRCLSVHLRSFVAQFQTKNHFVSIQRESS